jgi:hypothetical protein
VLFRSKFSDTPLNVTLEILIDATARGVCAELCGPLDLIAAVELDESAVAQGD